jgi:hypothetical protein
MHLKTKQADVQNCNKETTIDAMGLESERRFGGEGIVYTR